MFSSVVFAHAPYAFLPECWRSAGAAHMGRRPGGLYGQITHKACAKCVLTKLVKAQQKLQQLKFSSYLRWVAPFGNRRIKGYSHLPDAYRSVSRPSSPVHAKASTLDHSHCQYPSNISFLQPHYATPNVAIRLQMLVQRYQQKDQLLEIQSVARSGCQS